MKPSSQPGGLLLSIMIFALFSCASPTDADSSAASGQGSKSPHQPALPTAPGIYELEEQGHRFGLYLPEGVDYASGVPANLPVVLYLHGYTEDPLTWQPWIIAALQAKEPCVVLMPWCSPSLGSSAWGGTYDVQGKNYQAALRRPARHAMAELDLITARYGLDPQRQYLYGGSMGGEGVFMLLASFPKRFAAAIAGAGYTVQQGADRMAQTPLWMLHGSDDTVIPAESSRSIYKAIIQAGGKEVTYTEYPGLDHASIWPRLQEEPGLLDWLLSHRWE